jgi:hypothetical protein
MASMPDAKMFFFFLLSKHDALGPVSYTSTGKEKTGSGSSGGWQMRQPHGEIRNKAQQRNIFYQTFLAVENVSNADIGAEVILKPNIITKF